MLTNQYRKPAGNLYRFLRNCYYFLICFPMKYKDFSVKMNSENNSANTILISLFVKQRAFYEFSAKRLAQNV